MSEETATATEEREDGQLEITGIDTPLGAALKQYCDKCGSIEKQVKERDDLQVAVIAEMDTAGVNKVKFEGRTLSLVDPKPGSRHIRTRITRPEDSE